MSLDAVAADEGGCDAFGLGSHQSKHAARIPLPRAATGGQD
jgi:hypothetical protein